MEVRRAVLDPQLTVEVISEHPLYYPDGPDSRLDRPGHVRAGSGMARLRDGRLAIIQDDTAFIAFVDPDMPAEVTAVPLPRRGGARQFDANRHNKHEKYDFESCLVVDDALWLIGSGSTSAREVIAIYRPGRITVHEVPKLYDRFRGMKTFSGTELNLEGCLRYGAELWFFQRGNGAAAGLDQPVDAVAVVDLEAVRRHLVGGPVPEISSICAYDLGTIGGRRLTFTDVSAMPGGFLYSAAAEDSPNTYDDGVVSGTAIGVDDGETVRFAPITRGGVPWLVKVEGIATAGRNRLWAVTDEDDPAKPSRLLTLALRGPWFGEDVARRVPTA
jgi:hypothetical protein